MSCRERCLHPAGLILRRRVELRVGVPQVSTRQSHRGTIPLSVPALAYHLARAQYHFHAKTIANSPGAGKRLGMKRSTRIVSQANAYFDKWNGASACRFRIGPPYWWTKVQRSLLLYRRRRMVL